MKKIQISSLLFISLFSFISCTNDDITEQLPLGDFENGYFITNEGPFNNGTGTITFVDTDGTIVQNAYKSVNNEDLGNIVQSITLANDIAYIVVNNSNKIVVVNRYTLEKIAEIKGEGISNPRYIVAQGNIGYVSNWGDAFNATDDFISVIDLISNEVKKTIPVGEGPEEMLIENSRLFINLQGGYNQNNQVAVVDTNNASLLTNITVGEVPNSILADGVGNVWVLCEGKPAWTLDETAGKLYKISATTNATSFINFNETDHPNLLAFDSGSLFYNLNGKVYKMDATASQLPTQEVNGWDGFYYYMTASNGEIFATDAGNYSSEGSLKVYDISSGSLLETNVTGIIPGDIAFQ